MHSQVRQAAFPLAVLTLAVAVFGGLPAQANKWGGTVPPLKERVAEVGELAADPAIATVVGVSSGLGGLAGVGAGAAIGLLSVSAVPGGAILIVPVALLTLPALGAAAGAAVAMHALPYGGRTAPVIVAGSVGAFGGATVGAIGGALVGAFALSGYSSVLLAADPGRHGPSYSPIGMIVGAGVGALLGAGAGALGGGTLGAGGAALLNSE